MLFTKSFSFYFLMLVFNICYDTAFGKDLGIVASNAVLIDKDFRTVDLNRFLLLNTQLKTEDLAKKNLKELILQNSSTVNLSGSLLMVGEYHQYPDAWFYTQIINTSNALIDLVISEENHLRCDGLEVLSFRSDSLIHWGKMTRTTPFTDRKIPFYSYAIPISLSPKDTLNLLIHTQRKYGFHEVDLNIAKTPDFWSKTLSQFFLQLLMIVLLTLCMFIMCIIGWLFGDKQMLFLGYYLLAIDLLFLGSMGFMDTILHLPNIGLESSGIATPILFIVNAMYHPYGMQLMKPVHKNEKLFKIVGKNLVIVNLLLACSFILPIQLFHRYDLYLPLTMAIMAIFNIGWLFYSSIIAFFRAKIRYFLVAVSVSFLPFLIEQVSNIFFEERNLFMLKYNKWSFTMSILGVCLVTLFQLREKLISRKIHDNNINHLKDTMDDLRKNEIESIGRNLHDNVGNILASALGHLNLKTLNKENVQNLIKEAIAELRFLSHNLVKNDELPLTDKITKLTDNFDEFSAIRFMFSDYTKEALDKLSSIQQTNLYYMVHELYSNALKHSSAQEVVLQVFEDKNRVWLSVEDDGIGIDTKGVLSGIGLRNIRTRAKLSGFEINIDSSEKGTITTIEILL